MSVRNGLSSQSVRLGGWTFYGAQAPKGREEEGQ